MLAGAIAAGEPLETAYRARRDAESLPMYEMTTDLAAFPPSRPEQRLLLEALAGRPDEISRFLGVLAGIEPPTGYFAPCNLLRLLGARRLLRAGLARRRTRCCRRTSRRG